MLIIGWIEFFWSSLIFAATVFDLHSTIRSSFHPACQEILCRFYLKVRFGFFFLLYPTGQTSCCHQFFYNLQLPDKSKHGFEFLPKIRRMWSHLYNKGDDQDDEKQGIIRIYPGFPDNPVSFKTFRRHCRRRLNNVRWILSPVFDHRNDEFLWPSQIIEVDFWVI